MAVGRTPNPNWIPWVGLFTVIAGVIYQAGSITGQVERLNDRTGQLEAVGESRSDAINAINVRTARIEAKLDYLVPKDK